MVQEKLWFNENLKLNVRKVIRLSCHGNGLIIDVGGIHQQKRTGDQAHFPLHQVRIREILEKNKGSQKNKGSPVNRNQDTDRNQLIIFV